MTAKEEEENGGAQLDIGVEWGEGGRWTRRRRKKENEGGDNLKVRMKDIEYKSETKIKAIKLK